jgi:hypothetical protein
MMWKPAGLSSRWKDIRIELGINYYIVSLLKGHWRLMGIYLLQLPGTSYLFLI